MFSKKSAEIPAADQAIKGRADAMPLGSTRHYVNQHEIIHPWPEGYEEAMFGLGCFWGAERLFWKIPGVWVTAVGYSAGYTENASYQEVCSGLTGHNEVVLVVFDPSKVSYAHLLENFWQGHDPTQAMRQGNDVGTQYRSGVYTYSDAQQQQAIESRDLYQAQLKAAGYGQITTEIKAVSAFYYAETAHQQYLAKNPGGYCGLGGTGVSCAG